MSRLADLNPEELAGLELAMLQTRGDLREIAGDIARPWAYSRVSDGDRPAVGEVKLAPWNNPSIWDAMARKKAQLRVFMAARQCGKQELTRITLLHEAASVAQDYEQQLGRAKRRPDHVDLLLAEWAREKRRETWWIVGCFAVLLSALAGAILW